MLSYYLKGMGKMDFSKRLKKLRNEKDISQEELARLLNISRTSVTNYELGRNEASAQVLNKLSEIFNCSIDYLLGKSDTRNYDKDEQEFRFAYHKEMEGLTEDEIADALRFYKEMKKKYEQNKK